MAIRRQIGGSIVLRAFFGALPFETVREHILKEACFLEISQMKPGKTKVEAFKGLDRGDPWRMAMTLHVGAIRP